jgi:hypothetical protein
MSDCTVELALDEDVELALDEDVELELDEDVVLVPPLEDAAVEVDDG